MDMTKALDLDQGDILSIVGAGGKTSFLYSLAAETEKPCLFTTTTKMRSLSREDNPFFSVYTGPLDGLDYPSRKFPLFAARKQIEEKV